MVETEKEVEMKPEDTEEEQSVQEEEAAPIHPIQEDKEDEDIQSI